MPAKRLQGPITCRLHDSPPSHFCFQRQLNPLSHHSLFFLNSLFFASERERILEERRVNNESRTDLFDNMAKIIGERWRAIDPEQLQRLNAQAQVNSESYRKQMEEYSLRHLKRPPKDIEIVDLPGTSSNEPKSLESFLLEQPYGASFPVSLSAQAYLHSQHFFSPYNPLLATYTYPIDPHYHIWNQLPSHQSPSDALLHYYSVQERLRLGIEMAPSSTSERPGKSAETNKDNDEEAPHSNKEQPS